MISLAARKTFKYARSISKRGMALILTFAFMFSIGAVSGLNLQVSAATVANQEIYINTSQGGSGWSDATQIYARFADSNGNVMTTQTANVSSNNVAELTAPAGATKLEIVSNYNSGQYQNLAQASTVVPDNHFRIYFHNANSSTKFEDGNVKIYCYGSGSITDWGSSPAMTRIGDTNYYYYDIDKNAYAGKYEYVIFQDGTKQYPLKDQGGISVGTTYDENCAYINSSFIQANAYTQVIDLAQADTRAAEFYINSSGGVTMSKYITALGAGQSGNNRVTMKPVYVVKSSWNSLDQIYAKYDYTSGEPYSVSVAFTRRTEVNGQTVFQGFIPEGAAVKFGPNQDNENGATITTNYPAAGGYGDEHNETDTATYEIDSNNAGSWRKISEKVTHNYDAVTGSLQVADGSQGIISVDATYYDYLSDSERVHGYLLNADPGSYNEGWFPFTQFNSYISGIANSNSAWTYPLYFGNFYKSGNQYGYSSEISGLTRYNDNDPYYAINNSNGLSNYHQSIMGLAESTLDADGDIQAAANVKMPYFDTNKLAGSENAKVFKSYFPFRSSTNSSGVTTYTFDSTNATDNVFFTWGGNNNLTPTGVNYGAGQNYGVRDAGNSYGGSQGWGIFPFNNNSSHANGRNKGGRVEGAPYGYSYDNLNFGFGVRLDIDFRVPAYGTVDGTPNGDPVTFTYSGDDDLWVYISEDPTGANGQLVLDLGGDHKQASGSINFKDMTATADDVYYDYSTGTPCLTTVPSDEFWVKTGDYEDFCVYTWGSSTKYETPYATEDGYYKFRSSQFSGNLEAIFCKWKNVGDGKLSGDLTLSSLYGSAWNGNGSKYTGASVTKSFSVGNTNSRSSENCLDPNKTYHMVVFYMERGLSESNFSVSFTMTPANNDLKVKKALDASAVNSSIAADLQANESYNYEIGDGTTAASSVSYSIDGGSAQSLTNQNGAKGTFALKHSQTADFNNQYKTGNQVTVTESIPNTALSYTTSWELIDNNTGKTKSSGNSTSSTYKLENPENSEEYASLQLNYTNTVNDGSLKVAKNVVDEDGTTSYVTSQEFPFQVLIDLDGDGSVYGYKGYQLDYKYDGSSEVYHTGSDGSFTLRAGQAITLSGLPAGAKYKIIENSVVGYKPYKINTVDFNGEFNGEFEGVVGTTSSVDVSNIVSPTNTTITVGKTLDGNNYTGSLFDFTLTGLAAMQTDHLNASGDKIASKDSATITQKVQSSNGKVEFKNLSFVEEGYYRFMITESLASGQNADDFNMDERTFFVEVLLDSSGSIDANNTKYYAASNSEVEEAGENYARFFNDAYTAASTTFANTTTKGSATVNKKDQSGSSVPETEFAIFKIDSELKDRLTDEQIKAMAQTSNMTTAKTGPDGAAKFENITIFEDGQGQWSLNGATLDYNSTDQNNYISGTAEYQNYVLVELKPAEGYNPTSLRQYFTLPKAGIYDITLEDVIDGKIITPNAGDFGSDSHFALIGLGVLGFGTLCLGTYVYLRRRRSSTHYSR